MLLRIVSDVHMEHYRHATVPAAVKWDELVAPKRDRDHEAILILAGDICEFGYVMFFASAFKELAKRFKAVIWVPGNHEYFSATTPYGDDTFFYFKELVRKWGKIHLLDNSSVTIEGQKFYGATLWTNYDSNATAAAICQSMGDFRWARTYDGKEARQTIPQDYIDRHAKSTQLLDVELAKGEDLIVVTHFPPSFQSIHEKWRNAQPYETNYHFANRMDLTIIDNPQIKLWVHGHTHTQFDYMIEQTRVVCNPTGFPTEDTCRFADLDYVEVP